MPSRNLHHRVFLTAIIAFLCACMLQTTIYAQGKSDTTITIPQNFHATSFVSVDDKIIVQARLNDKVSDRFILDTGGYTSITRSIASRLGLSLTADQDATSETKYSVIAEIVMERVELTNVPVQVETDHFLDFWNQAHPSEKVAGFIGIDALKQWAIGVDFPSRTLGWWKGGKVTEEDIDFFSGVLRYPDSINGALLLLPPGTSIVMHGKTIVNKKFRSAQVFKTPLISKPDYDQVFVHASINGKEIELAWDTGADIISVPEVLAKDLHPLFREHTAVESADHHMQADVAILNTLSLGSLSFDLPLLGIVAHSSLIPEKDTPADIALLGLNPFTDCRIIMDFPGKMLYLNPYEDYNATILQIMKRSGIGLHRMENSRDFVSVFPHSPAASVGIQGGDELLTINGRQLTEILNGPEVLSSQSTLLLRVKRKSAKKVLEFTVPMR
jgi:predicted aspartyl protease